MLIGLGEVEIINFRTILKHLKQTIIFKYLNLPDTEFF